MSKVLVLTNGMIEAGIEELATEVLSGDVLEVSRKEAVYRIMDAVMGAIGVEVCVRVSDLVDEDEDEDWKFNWKDYVPDSEDGGGADLESVIDTLKAFRMSGISVTLHSDGKMTFHKDGAGKPEVDDSGC